MWEWLISPLDATRVHEISFDVAWHGRAMLLAWGILAPLAVLIARFFKVMPGQDWPRQLDSQVWWRTHWIGQTAVFGLSVVGFLLVVPASFADLGTHAILGYVMLGLLLLQVALGVFRGSKGGPTDPRADGSIHGHHYDMTRWRLMFEQLHKSIGYLLLGLGMVTILLGLWKANAPVWMWIVMPIWWVALIAVFWALQKRGMAIDTYQAIWGTDPRHPGNQMPAPGWGVRRPMDGRQQAGE